MQQDVFWLDVPVDHVVAMRVVERGRHLGRDSDGVRHRELLLAGEPVAHCLALDVGHDIEQKAVGLATVEEWQDMRMLQVGGGLDFAQEPLGADDGGELRPQHLDRHLPVMPQVLGEVDRSHPPLAEFVEEAVAVGQGSGEAGDVAQREAPALPCSSRISAGRFWMMTIRVPGFRRTRAKVLPSGLMA